MRTLALIRRELLGYFFSPLGWIVLALFLLVQGYGFYLVIELLNRPDAPHGGPMQVFFGGTFLYWLFLIVVVAAITMRLIAEERRSGTIEPLLSAPVTEAQVTLAKYGAAVLFYALLWLPTVLYVVVLWQLAGADAVAAGPIAAGYLGTLLLGATCIAIGQLASTVTRNQIVAALLTFAILSLLLLVGPLEMFTSRPVLRAIISHINLFDHIDDFARGIVDTRHVIFHLSVIGFCLTAAAKLLQRRKWS